MPGIDPHPRRADRSIRSTHQSTGTGTRELVEMSSSKPENLGLPTLGTREIQRSTAVAPCCFRCAIKTTAGRRLLSRTTGPVTAGPGSAVGFRSGSRQAGSGSNDQAAGRATKGKQRGRR